MDWWRPGRSCGIHSDYSGPQSHQGWEPVVRKYWYVSRRPHFEIICCWYRVMGLVAWGQNRTEWRACVKRKTRWSLSLKRVTIPTTNLGRAFSFPSIFLKSTKPQITQQASFIQTIIWMIKKSLLSISLLISLNYHVLLKKNKIDSSTWQREKYWLGPPTVEESKARIDFSNRISTFLVNLQVHSQQWIQFYTCFYILYPA